MYDVIHDLVDADMIHIGKSGRTNEYFLNAEARFRHPTLSHIRLMQFQKLLAEQNG